MSIVLPNASASELSGLSSCASDSDSASTRPPMFTLPLQPKYACASCSLSFRRRDALDRHEVAAHNVQPRFRCTITADCGRVYTNSSHLRRHVRVFHKADTAGAGRELRAQFVTGVKCSQDGCPRVFASTAAMQLHATQTHRKRRDHQCPDCPEAFYRKQQLKAHRYKHTGVYPYHCDGCAAGFLNMQLLTRHLRGCAEAAAKAEAVLADEPNAAGADNNAPAAASARPTVARVTAKHRCTVCDRQFVKWSKMVEHRREAHPPHCDRCNRSFSSQISLRNHRAKVLCTGQMTDGQAPPDGAHQAIACTEPTCSRVFGYERNMLAHWRTHHGDRRFECERCGMQLVSKKKIEQHLEWHMRHPDYVVRDVGQQRFACTVADCDRRYVRRQALLAHLRECHPGVEAPAPAKRMVTVAERLAGVRADGGADIGRSDGDEVMEDTGEVASVDADGGADMGKSDGDEVMDEEMSQVVGVGADGGAKIGASDGDEVVNKTSEVVEVDAGGAAAIQKSDGDEVIEGNGMAVEKEDGKSNVHNCPGNSAV